LDFAAVLLPLRLQDSPLHPLSTVHGGVLTHQEIQMPTFQTSRRFMAAFAVAALSTLAMAPSTSFATKTASGEYNSLHAGLGAKGYDVVSYFTTKKPTQGSDKFTASYGGVTWQFASAENRDMFKADPAKYAPQFGGYCAWGVAQGKLFDIDPVNGWTVSNGKLYLNFNNDINTTFARDAEGFVSKAGRNWPELNK
jgi:YHS domain-containing protein